MNACRTYAYRISWAVFFGQIAFAISLVVTDLLHRRYEAWVNDDGSLLTAFLGMWAGWRFAIESVTWHKFHALCLIVGGFLTPIFVAQAVRHHQQAEALSGTWFMAGLGEAIWAAWCLYLSVGSLCLLIAGTAATWNGWRFSLRTLLVGLTCAAASLGTISLLSR